MKKRSNLALDELRELAKKKDSYSLYSDARKMEIFQAHLVDHVPITHLSKKFGISRQTIYEWMRNFADGKLVLGKQEVPEEINPKVLPMSKKKESLRETESEELQRLREENRRLSEALKMAEWSNHAKDVMIDIAEETFNIPIRKKSGAKQ